MPSEVLRTLEYQKSERKTSGAVRDALAKVIQQLAQDPYSEELDGGSLSFPHDNLVRYYVYTTKRQKRGQKWVEKLVKSHRLLVSIHPHPEAPRVDYLIALLTVDARDDYTYKSSALDHLLLVRRKVDTLIATGQLAGLRGPSAERFVPPVADPESSAPVGGLPDSAP